MSVEEKVGSGSGRAHTGSAHDTSMAASNQVAPVGRLPVTIPAADGGVLYPIGHGLT